MNLWDFLVVGLISLIDLTPVWDFIFAPLTWILTVFGI